MAEREMGYTGTSEILWIPFLSTGTGYRNKPWFTGKQLTCEFKENKIAGIKWYYKTKETKCCKKIHKKS